MSQFSDLQGHVGSCSILWIAPGARARQVLVFASHGQLSRRIGLDLSPPPGNRLPSWEAHASGPSQNHRGLALIAPRSSGERRKADLQASPARVGQRGAFVPTVRAAGRAAQHIARCVRTPPDDERRNRYRAMMSTSGAVKPKPRRASMDLTESRDGGH